MNKSDLGGLMLSPEEMKKKKAGEVLEADVEAALVTRVESLGGLCEKFTSPGRRSVPDRLVTLPPKMLRNPWIVLVECKRPGEEPTTKQANDHKRRRDLGCEVWVIDAVEQAKAFPYTVQFARDYPEIVKGL